MMANEKYEFVIEANGERGRFRRVLMSHCAGLNASRGAQLLLTVSRLLDEQEAEDAAAYPDGTYPVVVVETQADGSQRIHGGRERIKGGGDGE